jgi:hypothetical protein
LGSPRPTGPSCAIWNRVSFMPSIRPLIGRESCTFATTKVRTSHPRPGMMQQRLVERRRCPPTRSGRCVPSPSERTLSPMKRVPIHLSPALVSHGIIRHLCSLPHGCRTAVGSPLHHCYVISKTEFERNDRSREREHHAGQRLHSERSCSTTPFSLSFRYVAQQQTLSFRHRSSVGATFWNSGLGG